jgi:hypothetical protein
MCESKARAKGNLLTDGLSEVCANTGNVVPSIPCIAGWHVDDDFGAAAVGWSCPRVIASPAGFLRLVTLSAALVPGCVETSGPVRFVLLSLRVPKHYWRLLFEDSFCNVVCVRL